MRKSFTERIENWIKDGSIETEFGVTDLCVQQPSKAVDGCIVLAGTRIENKDRCAIVIENRPSTDYGLGQLMVLQSVNDSVIWIAASFTEEHKKAIEWIEKRCNVWISKGWYNSLFEEPPKLLRHE
ncbi:MAG: hypothetical protein IJ791_06890 [Lachnospiraceae bacterium]|nr:hypothetical protein [Lachnospiraceae bacterium]